jgi:hypothetical protein
MATKELRELRYEYEAAYKTYMSSVQSLSDASERGEWPKAEVMKQESVAFTDLALIRHALLEELQEYTRAK